MVKPVAMLITDSRQLADYCRKARGAAQVFVDSEFVREETYYPQLELVQVLADGETALVDVRGVEDMSPLWEMLLDPAVRKVLHAAQQDLELFHLECGQAVTNVFDTQIAAAVVGIGEQVGYAQLVRQITGNSVMKTQSYTSWNARPFTPAQLEYAADDVRYLPEIARTLDERLQELGRTDWAREECERLERSAPRDGVPPEEMYLRISGVEKLDGKELAVLRELAVWRDEAARRRNIPVQKVLRDNSLTNIARHQPGTVSDLKDLRGFPIGVAERYGGQIVARVKNALALPREKWPEKLKPRQTDPQMQAVVSLLATFVRIRAQDAGIAWGLLATARDLEELLEAGDCADRDGLPVLQGWRNDLVGRDILRLLAGEISLTIDPSSGRPAIRENGAL